MITLAHSTSNAVRTNLQRKSTMLNNLGNTCFKTFCTNTNNYHEHIWRSSMKHYNKFDPNVTGQLPLAPKTRIAILTCMDARIDPYKLLNFQEGDCHVIRNAGGRVKDALRSLIMSQEIGGTRHVVIIHHTDCGSQSFNEAHFKSQFKNVENSADLVRINFLPFEHADMIENVKREVTIYKSFKGVLRQDIPVSGYLYDVKHGYLQYVYSS